MKPKSRDEIAKQFRMTFNGVMYQIERQAKFLWWKWWYGYAWSTDRRVIERDMERDIDMAWGQTQEWKPVKDKCICTKVCDCQSPQTNPAMVSNECPVHNDDPDPNPECPIHKEGRI
jgi:hypothetical protein